MQALPGVEVMAVVHLYGPQQDQRLRLRQTVLLLTACIADR